MPELVPIRYGRMLGLAVHLLPRRGADHGGRPGADPASGVTVQLCGDAHLSNFGLFGSPERQLLFDINDFDETLPGPWEWDVKRLAASFEVMGRDRGFSPADRAGDGHGRRPRVPGPDASRGRDGGPWRPGTSTSRPGSCSSWSARRSASSAWASSEAARRGGRREGAYPRQHPRLAKRADEIDGELRIVADPPIIVPIDDLGCPAPTAERRRRSRAADALARRATGARSADHHHPLEEYRYVDTGPQGRRRRQRRHPLLHPAASSAATTTTRCSSSQGGAAVGARTVPRPERVSAPRPARRRRSAADAGGDRHLPRLAADHAASTA